MRIMWADETALAFWEESSLSSILKKAFDPASDIVAVLNSAFIRVTENDEPIETDIIVTPAESPIRLRCQMSLHQMYDGREGLRIRATHYSNIQNAHIDRFKEILNQSPKAISLFNDEGYILWQNMAAHYLFGADARTYMLGDRYNNKDIAADVLSMTLANGFYAHTEKLKTQFGERRYRIDLRRIHDRVTDSDAVVMFMRDITDYIHIQKPNLQSKSADLCRNTLHDINIPTLQIDNSLSVMASNTGAQEIFGQSLAENKSIEKIFTEQKGVLSTALSQLEADPQTPVHIKLRSSSACADSKGTRWFKAIFYSDTSSQILVSFFDITQAHKLEIKDKFQVKERVRALQNAGIGVAYVTSEGIFQDIDPQSILLLGGAQYVKVGGSLWELLEPTPKAQHLKACLLNGHAFNAADIQTCKNNECVQLSMAEAHPAQPALRCMVIQSADDGQQKITKHTRDLVTNTSHELRTPLNNILGFIEILLTSDALSKDKIIEYLQDVKESGVHMSRLLDALVEAAHDSATRKTQNKTQVNIDDLCRRILRTMAASAQENNISLKFRGSPSAHSLKVWTNEDVVRQILNNLIMNAIMHAGAGSSVFVDISYEQRTIRIHDNGVGMTEQELKQAMQMFGQVLKPGIVHRSGGLGLPIAKQLVEKNGWTFDIQSQPSIGTTITICLG